MKKTIFLFFAAILCAMSATAATYYYRGAKNSWGATPLTLSADGAYYYYQASAGAHEFKLTDNDSWSGAEYTNITPTKYNKTDITLSKPGNVKSPSTAAHYILLYFGNDNATPVVCASTTLPNGLNDVWIKHDWGGAGSWTYKQATNNGDGTFSLSANYGASGCNINAYNGNNAQWYYGVSDMDVEAGLQKGDEAVFTVNAVTRKITVTKKVNKNLGDITITMNCNQQPKIFFWDVEGKTCAEWPGEDMVAAGANTYTYTFEDVDVDLGVNYKINLKAVNENEWASGDLHTTSDVTHDASIFGIPEIVVLGVNGDWGATNTLTEQSTDYLTVSKTITVTEATHDLKCHVGSGQYYGSSDVNITRENPSSNKFDKDYGNGNGKFVADIAGDYVFTWTYKTGTLTVTYPELPTPEYKDITITVYAKEVPNIWWWNGGDQCPSTEELINPSTGDKYKWTEAPAMEKVAGEDNWYTKTFAQVDITRGGIKFKLQSTDHNASTTNEVVTTEDKCYDARVIATVTETTCGELPSGEVPTVTYNVTVPAGTNTCYIAGEMNGWKFTDEMTKVDDTHYTITIEGATTAHKYKYTSGPDWAWVEVIDGDRTYSPNDVVTAWNAVYDPSAPVYDYYIVGSMNSWNQNSADHGMTDDNEDGIYEKKLTLKNNDEFKVKGNEWYGFDAIEGAYVETSLSNESDRNIKITLDADKEVTVKFNSETKKITFEGLTEKAPVVSTYALMGVGGDWTTGITMTVNPDNADEYVLKAQSISSTDAIKVLETAGSTQTWHSTVDAYSNATFELVDDGFGGKNIVLTAGTYNFYFKKINNEIYIEEVYVRDVTNTYGTICLPYASNSYDGAIFYRVAGKETGKVYLESVSELVAGVPYIFEKTASKIVVARNGAPVANAGTANGLVGTFTDETPVAAGNYILYSNYFRPSNGTAKVNANRAYLVMEDIVGGQPTQMPGRKYIGMDVQGENEATGFENIVAPEGQTIKAIVNGQLVIIRGGEMYNVQGQKL